MVVPGWGGGGASWLMPISSPQQRPGPEFFDLSSCPGEWLGQPDWTLEGVGGPQAQGLPPRHTHPHGPPRATSFLQHVGGHH